LIEKSETDARVLDSERLLGSLVRVSTDEILKEKLGVCEIRGIVIEGLSVTTNEGLLQVSGPPDPLFHLITSEEVLTLLDELISAELDVLIEQVATEDLLAILVVDKVADYEKTSEGSLGNECHVLVVEHDVVVVKENESGDGCERHVLLVVGVLNVQIGHIIIPFGVVGVQEHSFKRELRANTLCNVEEIEHLLNRLVALLTHTSIRR